MKIYGLVLAALAVFILGGKFLHAGSSSNAQAKAEKMAQATDSKESDRELVLRWQQNRANHWRGYMLQQQ